MKKAKVDRRVLYTKALLTQGLTELLQENHISKISVKSLCAAADVNRSTFYTHYQDQFDLLGQVEEEVLSNLKQFLEQYVDDRRPITEQSLKGILEYAKANQNLFTALLGENCNRSFHKDLMELVALVPFQYNIDEKKKNYILNFAVTGCISILHEWLKTGAAETPEEMAALVLKVIYNGLLSF